MGCYNVTPCSCSRATTCVVAGRGWTCNYRTFFSSEKTHYGEKHPAPWRILVLVCTFHAMEKKKTKEKKKPSSPHRRCITSTHARSPPTFLVAGTCTPCSWVSCYTVQLKSTYDVCGRRLGVDTQLSHKFFLKKSTMVKNIPPLGGSWS